VGTSKVGRSAVVSALGITGEGAGVEVSTGSEVGVNVKVAVGCGFTVGVAEAGTVSVGSREGTNGITLSAVGVE